MSLSLQQLQSFIAKPGPQLRALLLYGQDQAAMRGMRQQFVMNYAGPNADADMRLTELHRDAIKKDPASLLDAMTASGFFPGPRVVMIDAATDAITDIIATALRETGPDDAFLFVLADSLTKRSKLRKLFESTPGMDAAGIYENPITREDVERIAQERGLTIEGADLRDALFALARSSDLATFTGIVERLALYKLSDSTPLTVDELLELVPGIGDEGFDALLHNVASGAAREIPGAFRVLLAQGENPTSLVIRTERYMNQLYSLVSHPDGPRRAVAALRPPVFGARRDRILEQAACWRRETLEQAIAELLELDLKLRSSPSVPASALIERSLIRIAMMGARGRRR